LTVVNDSGARVKFRGLKSIEVADPITTCKVDTEAFHSMYNISKETS